MKTLVNGEKPRTVLFDVEVGHIRRYCYLVMNSYSAFRAKYLQRASTLIRDVCVGILTDLSINGRDMETFLHRYDSEGLSFVTQTLPVLAKALERGVADGVFVCPTHFRGAGPRSALPAFLGSLFNRVFDKRGNLLEKADSVAVYAIRQLCYLCNKIDLPRHPSKDAKVEKTFLENEDLVRNHTFDKCDPVSLKAQALIRGLFRDYDHLRANNKHGPGVVSNCALTKKYEANLSDSDAFWSNPLSFFYNGQDFWDRYSRLPHRSIFDFSGRKNPSAKVVLVPKDARGPRLISSEPMENQFLQQGIMDYMVSKLENHVWTGGHVNFTDQTVNQLLAKDASVNLRMSTMDLKDASDLVSWDLVSFLFDGTSLLPALTAVRSETTLLNGVPVEQKKHAPMGSAVCFPVMASAIWALLVANATIKFDTTISSASESIYVYGDDIIVPTDWFDSSALCLETYGLKVNRAKSFKGSRFAESCGFDSFDGNDVTPIRLKKVNHTWEETITKENSPFLLTMTKTAMSLYRSGLKETSEILYKSVERYLGPLPYGTPQSPYLCREAPLGARGTLMELNYIRRPMIWRKRRNRQRYPDGLVMVGWTTESATQNDMASFGGHQLRIGARHYDPLDYLDPRRPPTIGEFVRPRDYLLVKKTFEYFQL